MSRDIAKNAHDGGEFSKDPRAERCFAPTAIPCPSEPSLQNNDHPRPNYSVPRPDAFFRNVNVTFLQLRRHLQLAQPYMGFVYVTCLTSFMIVLIIFSCCWICLFRDVHFFMPRTFAWELVTQMLGSYYNDCVDRSNGDVVGIPLTSAQQCPYNASFPWIPVIEVGICIGTVATVVAVWTFRLVGRKVQFFRTGGGGMGKSILIFLGTTASIYYGWGQSNVNASLEGTEAKLLGRMQFAMKPNTNEEMLLSHEDFRWKVTQIRGKCCGIKTASDWKSGIFNSFQSDPRYPLSCCNTEVHSYCSSYPTRYQVWEEGCYEKELCTLKDYRGRSVLLLVFSWTFVLLVIVFFWLLENFLQGQPLVPPGFYTRLSLFLKRNDGGNDPELELQLQRPVAENNEQIGEPADDNKFHSNGQQERNAENGNNNSNNNNFRHIGNGDNNENFNHPNEVETEPETCLKSCNKGKCEQLDIKPLYSRRFKTVRTNVLGSSNATQRQNEAENNNDKIPRIETWV